MTHATIPQESQFYRLAANNDISYAHQLILKLPIKLQNTAWKINFAVKLCFYELDIVLVAGTALRLGLSTSLPALACGLAIGAAIRYIPVRRLNPLKTDDKAWTLVAAVIVSLLTGFPIGIFCGAMLYCLVPSRKLPQPASVEEKGKQIIDRFFRTYRNQPKELVRYLRQLQTQNSRSDTFTFALEAYLKIVCLHRHMAKNELYELLYGEQGLMTTYEKEKPHEQELSFTPFLNNCHRRRTDETVALWNGVRSIEIANSSKGYNYTSLTIVYGPHTSKEITQSLPPSEGQLIGIGEEPYFYGPQSKTKTMNLMIKNQCKDLALQVEVKNDEGVLVFEQVEYQEEKTVNVSNLAEIHSYPLEVQLTEYKILT